MKPIDATIVQQDFASKHPDNPVFIKGTPEAKAHMAALRAKVKKPAK